MPRACTLLPFLFLFSSLFSQQTTDFRFGSPEWERLHRVFETSGGTINVIGDQNVNGLPRVQFFQLSPAGAVLREKDLGPMAVSLLVEPEAGGSFWLARFGATGYTFSRYDADGELLDSMVYAHPQLGDDYFFAVRRAPNGDFVLAFKDYTTPGIRLVRLTASGTVVFSKFVSSPDADFYNNCLAVLPDGRTVLAVIDYTSGYRVICYSPTGALLWTKGMPAVPHYPEDLGLLPLDNGQVVFYGPGGSNGNGGTIQGYAAAYNVDGSFAWNRTFESVAPFFRIYEALADGDFAVLAGDVSNLELGAAVVKVAPNGDLVFARKFPLLNVEHGKMLRTADGDYLMAGFRWRPGDPFGHVASEAYCLSLQPEGTQNWYVEGQYNWINAVRSIAQSSNGDVWVGGNYRPTGSTDPFDHYLLNISGFPALLGRQVQGRLTLDSIPNCLPDPGEAPLSAWTIRARNNAMTRYATTGADGRFSIRLDGDDAELTVIAPNGLWASCATAYNADFSASDTVDIDPLEKQLAQCPALLLDGSTPFLRRCFDNTYVFSWRNTGTAPARQTVMKVLLDKYFTLVSASLPVLSQTGQLLTFDLGDIQPGAWQQLSLTVNVSCDAALGEKHCLSASLEAEETCPGNDGHTATLRDCQVNIGSFDPNDKRAFVYDEPWEGLIQPNTNVKYQIRFQNTGTDTAFNVVIVDTLPLQLNLDSIVPAGASHPYTWYRTGENILKIVFNDIRLPDSLTNEPASHGFVNLLVQQKPDLPDGTRIENKAGIYFDFNEPIITNTHRLVVDRSLSANDPVEQTPEILVYPNPAADGNVWIKTGETVERLEVFDAQGRLLRVLYDVLPGQEVVLPPAPGVYGLRVHAPGRQPVWRKAVRAF